LRRRFPLSKDRTDTSIHPNPKGANNVINLQNIAADRPPILWTALGRQRVGKTVLLNTTAQYFRGLGNPLRVWNADQQNRTHTLSTFFPDAEEISGGGIEDSVSWMEGRIEDQIAHGYDAVLDVGGGAAVDMNGSGSIERLLATCDRQDGIILLEKVWNAYATLHKRFALAEATRQERYSGVSICTNAPLVPFSGGPFNKKLPRLGGRNGY
jgi:hypothetical protein